MFLGISRLSPAGLADLVSRQRMESTHRQLSAAAAKSVDGFVILMVSVETWNRLCRRYQCIVQILNRMNRCAARRFCLPMPELMLLMTLILLKTDLSVVKQINDLRNINIISQLQIISRLK